MAGGLLPGEEDGRRRWVLRGDGTGRERAKEELSKKTALPVPLSAQNPVAVLPLYPAVVPAPGTEQALGRYRAVQLSLIHI